jgi:hypothetical protein
MTSSPSLTHTLIFLSLILNIYFQNPLLLLLLLLLLLFSYYNIIVAYFASCVAEWGTSIYAYRRYFF